MLLRTFLYDWSFPHLCSQKSSLACQFLIIPITSCHIIVSNHFSFHYIQHEIIWFMKLPVCVHLCVFSLHFIRYGILFIIYIYILTSVFSEFGICSDTCASWRNKWSHKGIVSTLNLYYLELSNKYILSFHFPPHFYFSYILKFLLYCCHILQW